jgi:hypothetical protein
MDHPKFAETKACFVPTHGGPKASFGPPCVESVSQMPDVSYPGSLVGPCCLAAIAELLTLHAY